MTHLNRVGYFRRWVRRALSAPQGDRSRSGRRARCHVELLEDRCVPSATLVTDANSDSFDSITSSSSGGAQAVVNGTLFFLANDAVHGLELWKSDGTEAGTVMVKDIRPGTGGAFGPGASASLTAFGNTLFFNADDGSTGKNYGKATGLKPAR